MTADLGVVRKALLAACGEVRGGDAAAEEEVPGEAGASLAWRSLDGLAAAFVASPGSTDEAAAVMRVAAEHELAVVVRGGGSRLPWGTPPSRCDLVVDTSRMSGVVEHAAGDLVARVRAGTRMGDVQAVLARAGQEIALDVPDDATIGGVVASGLAGPRRLRYGTPRDLLIGMTIVRADGTVAKSGGKVVKNVAGYDLGKLFAGSAGTLGLITEVIFRLHPLPEARAYVTAEYVALAVACDAVAAAANSPLVASAVELSRAEPRGTIRVGVLLEGSSEGVAARAARMADLLGPTEVTADRPAWWPGAPQAGSGQTLVRVSFWVSALSRVLDAIEAAADKSGVSPVTEGSAGAGVLYIRVGPGAAAEFAGALRGSLAGERGGVAVLAAPAAVREALESGGDPAAATAAGTAAGQDDLAGGGPVRLGGMTGYVPGLALMRAVKDQFDPGHRMAPGRFPEVL